MDMNPEKVKDGLAKPGNMIMVDDPRVAARELKRKPLRVPLPDHLRAPLPPNLAAAVAATWVRRDLTTLVRNTIGASLASNQVTLPAGTYFIRWTAPAYKTRGHKTRLYDVSSSATIAYGTSEWAEYNGYVQNSSSGSSVFTLATTGTIALDHYTLFGSGSMGLASGGVTEVYARLEIWKVS